VLEHITGLTTNWEKDNKLKQQTIEIQKEQIELFAKRMIMDERKIKLEEVAIIRELEKDLDMLEDQLDDAPNEKKRRRIEIRIESLKTRMAALEE
jgi:hypothetical protein